jgi:hypothetical protein
MYAVEYIKLLKLLERKEIIEHMLKVSPHRAGRFISLYKLTNEEIDMFEEQYKDSYEVHKKILYYQRNNKKVY